MTDFTGKVVLITGGAQGIGLATVEAFSRAGARVISWDYDPRALEAAQRDLAAKDLQVEYHQVNVRRTRQVERAASEILQKCRQLDVLINNAGVNFGDQSAAGISDQTWELILGINLKGTVNTVRCMASAMVERRCGCIINTTSTLARSPGKGFGAYAAAKSGIIALTRSWARELGPSGIRVNAVSPGFIDTPMNAGMPQEVRAQVIARTSLGRMGRPDEVAQVHLFLASEEGSFINGAVIAVDGGLAL